MWCRSRRGQSTEPTWQDGRDSTCPSQVLWQFSMPKRGMSPDGHNGPWCSLPPGQQEHEADLLVAQRSVKCKSDLGLPVVVDKASRLSASTPTTGRMQPPSPCQTPGSPWLWTGSSNCPSVRALSQNPRRAFVTALNCSLPESPGPGTCRWGAGPGPRVQTQMLSDIDRETGLVPGLPPKTQTSSREGALYGSRVLKETIDPNCGVHGKAPKQLKICEPPISALRLNFKTPHTTVRLILLHLRTTQLFGLGASGGQYLPLSEIHRPGPVSRHRCGFSRPLKFTENYVSGSTRNAVRTAQPQELLSQVPALRSQHPLSTRAQMEEF